MVSLCQTLSFSHRSKAASSNCRDKPAGADMGRLCSELRLSFRFERRMATEGPVASGRTLWVWGGGNLPDEVGLEATCWAPGY
jgi:hypothetical protein